MHEDELRMRTKAGNNGHNGEAESRMSSGTGWPTGSGFPDWEDCALTYKEFVFIAKIAFVGAAVAVAVNYFIEPAAKTAVKLR